MLLIYNDVLALIVIGLFLTMSICVDGFQCGNRS